MADSQTLSVILTADSSRFTAAMSEAVAITQAAKAALGDAATQASSSGVIYDQFGNTLEKVAASSQTATAAISEVTAANTAGTAAAERHAEAEGLLGASMGKAETFANSMARAFSVAGVETQVLTDRVFAAAGAFDALAATAGPVALLVGGLMAVGGAVSFIHDSVKEVEDFRDSFNTLGQSVKNAGGNWDAAKGSVESYIDKMEEASQFTRNELIGAFNELYAATHSITKTEELLALATEIATAKHRDLMEVTRSLEDAEAGRGQALVRMFPILKQLREAHGDLGEAMEKLHHEVAGQGIQSMDAYKKSVHDVSVAMDELKRSVGEDWSGIVTAANEGAASVIRSLQGMVNAEHESAGALNNSAHAMAEALKGHWGSAGQAIKAGVVDLSRFIEHALLPDSNVGSGIVSFLRGAGKKGGDEAGADAAQAYADAFARQAVHAMSGQHFGLTDPKAKAAAKSDAEALSAGIHQVEEAFKRQQIGMSGADARLAALGERYSKVSGEANKLADATDRIQDAQRRADEAAEKKAERAGVTAEHKAEREAAKDQADAIHQRIDDLKNEFAQSQITYGAAVAGLRSIRAEYHLTAEQARSVGDAINEVTRQNVQREKEASEHRKMVWEGYYRSLLDHERDLVAHNKETLSEMAAHLQTWVAQHASAYAQIRNQAVAALDEIKSKEYDVWAKAADEWGKQDHQIDEFVDKQIEGSAQATIKQIQDRVKLREETIADAKAELEAMLAYYQAMGEAGAAAAQKVQDAIDKLSEEQIAQAQRVLDEQKRAIDQWADKLTEVIDNVIFKHKSLRDQLKDIWQGIVSDYLAAMVKAGLEHILLPGGTQAGTPSPTAGPGGIPPQGPGSNIWSVIFGGAGTLGGAGGGAANQATQAVQSSTSATTQLDTDIKTLTQAIRDLTASLKNTTSGSGGAGLQFGGSALGFGGGQSGGLITDSNILASAVNAASSYGILGALIGATGAASVISVLPSATGATTSGGGGGGIYAPTPPLQAPADSQFASGGYQPYGTYAYGTQFEGPLLPGGPWVIYNVFAGQSGTATPSYPSITGSNLSSTDASAVNSMLLGAGANSSAVTGEGGGGGGGGAGFGATGGGVASSVLGLGFGGGGGGLAGQLGGGASLSNLKIGGVGLGGVLQSAAIGYTVGSILSSTGLFKGNNDAAVGGAVGGAIGDIAGGPVGGFIGGAIGDVLGSLIGGLFGSHTNAETSPDIYDTERFGTIVADLQGQMGANGQQFYEEASVRQITGGLTGIAFVEMVLAKYGTKENAPPWLQGYWDTLVGMFGISSSGSGRLQFQHNIGEMGVVGAEGASGTFSYLDYGQALATFLQAYASNVGDAGPPAAQYNLSRSGSGGVGLSYQGVYNPTFGTSSSGAPPGPGVPLGIGGGSSLGFGLGGGGQANARSVAGTTFGGIGITSGGSGFGGAGYSQVGGGGNGPAIYVDLRGAQVVGPGGLADIAVTISQALQRLANGEIGGAARFAGSSPALSMYGDW
jgi:hypothetical protein